MTDQAARLPVARIRPSSARCFTSFVRSVAFRRGVVLVALALLWQIAADFAANPLLLPSFSQTAAALWDALLHENLA